MPGDQFPPTVAIPTHPPIRSRHFQRAELATDLPSPVAMVFERPIEGRRAVPMPSPTEIPALPGPPTEPTDGAPMAKTRPVPPPTPPDAMIRVPNTAPSQPRPPIPKARPSFPLPQADSFESAGVPRVGGPPAANTTPGPAPAGEMSFGQFAKLTAGHVEPNWTNALHDWWLRHGYYPSQAVALQQAGLVRIQIVVDRSGRVRNVALLRSAESPWLDMGAQDVFRGSTVPPFPPNTKDEQITLELTINYILRLR